MATKKTTTTAKKTTTTKSTRKPSAEKIRMEIELKSYEIYQKRVENFLPGDPVSDWDQAEIEVNGKYGIK